MATLVIQQGQNQRLAIDFLPSDQLQSLYSKLQLQAWESGPYLLTSQTLNISKLSYLISLTVLMFVTYGIKRQYILSLLPTSTLFVPL
jgi:hypothetical protein